MAGQTIAEGQAGLSVLGQAAYDAAKVAIAGGGGRVWLEVLGEAQKGILEAAFEHTGQNASKAARILARNRASLRTDRKRVGLIP